MSGVIPIIVNKYDDVSCSSLICTSVLFAAESFLRNRLFYQGRLFDWW